ncbi:MAG: UDP-N-acetylmuramate dehydrogenase [Phycisphaerae bacterium]
MNWHAGFSEIVRENESLAPFTWFKLGGPARWLIEPRSEDEFATVLRRCGEEGIPLRLLGRGANLLVADEGVDGAVIRLAGPDFEWVLCERGRVTAGAGADLGKLVKATAKKGLSGLEVLAGIPATVGGAVRMNCGGKYGDIGDRVTEVVVISRLGVVRQRKDVTFDYRSTDLGDDFVVRVTFELEESDVAASCDRYQTIWREKMKSQPALGDRTAGCIFRNPPGGKAGAIIEQAGLKGMRCGGACVSDAHANFIVATDDARAADVLSLIERIQTRVRKETGVRLTPEVEFWGPAALEQQIAAYRDETMTDADESMATGDLSQPVLTAGAGTI